eukprot:TRINITY_DN13422_c0_g2_i1.p1 TRINITY_DN13422_c0_g2~~TRINITY_DN13422_c0_g2_i1.p1  ORF type:complete len:1113 (-),score=188.46 TRINITY_DN13422_c0_g2_i1:284-3562(-)
MADAEFESPMEDRASCEDEAACLNSAEDENVEVLNDEEEPVEEECAPEDNEEAAPAAEDAGDGANAEINVTSFEDLLLDSTAVNDCQESWKLFVNSAASKEAAGDAIYGALFEASPAMQHLFVSPRAIAAMKFMAGIHSFNQALSDPPELKAKVENLAFGHLALEVTIPRVILFRNALLDLFSVELGSKLTSAAAVGWKAMLNYVGGAIIYIKKFYAERISLLGESWKLANKAESPEEKAAAEAEKSEKRADGEREVKKSDSIVQNVPTTFKEMFQFNAAVMGFGSSIWMNEVLACFGDIVMNIANPTRLSEECDFIVCRIARVSTGKINLSEFKSGMLASLRSLLPKDWTTQHEVAWSWLWDLVERSVVDNLGSPRKWENAYSKFLDGIDEATGFQLRRDIYLKFFALAPAGQDYFKQSNTYLHLVSTKVLTMVLDLYRDPVRMVDDISSVGLRHVGYGISVEFVNPFASSTVEVISGLTDDQVCIDGFAWSLGLISKSVMRTITEGSTIVMKAINTNSTKSMTRALSAAPRGERSKWMLLIQVGSQNISPLAWSIESGALYAASAMLQDLLTFRADRERYYYAADELFVRHPDCILRVLSDAPSLLPELLDGLIWRSRIAINGVRRVNYYVKHLLVDPEDKFAKTLDWVIRAKDPKIVCHPVLVWLTDDVWSRVAARSFVVRKSWFVFVLIVFVVTQSVLSKHKTEDMVWPVFALRAFIYIFSLGGISLSQITRCFKSIKSSDFVRIGRIPMPRYLASWQEAATICLMALLIGMLVTEPILHCLTDSTKSAVVAGDCKGSSDVVTLNSKFSMFALFLYCILLLDLAVFSNRISAYVLVVARMLSEVGLFLFALFSMLLTFSSGLGCLVQSVPAFNGIHTGSIALWEMFIGRTDEERYHVMHEEPLVLLGSFVFMITTSIFLLNLLIAQLSCAYDAIYADMVGHARIKRIRTIVESMPSVTPKRWEVYVDSLCFDTKIEFNEGDIGLNNGVACTEPANAHPTTVDVIKRFGGSTSVEIQWPEEDGVGGDESDKFERLETIIKRAMERITKSETGGKKKGGGGSSAADAASADRSLEEAHEDEEEAAASGAE